MWAVPSESRSQTHASGAGRRGLRYQPQREYTAGTSFSAFAVGEGASIKWLLQVWDCFSVLYDGLSAVGYLSNGGLFLPYCEDAQHQSFRSLSDLPGRADSKVALHLFDRRGRPSSKEGPTDSRNVQTRDPLPEGEGPALGKVVQEIRAKAGAKARDYVLSRGVRVLEYGRD